MRTTTRDAFERMAEAGTGDAGALAMGLRSEVTSVGLRALAAKALHVAAAAPERVADIYDNAAAGWLSGPVFPPRLRTEEPLPISPGFWKVFWNLVRMPVTSRNAVLAEQTLRLAGELDPRINARMAATALEYPGVAEAAAHGIPEPFDLSALEACGPASLGFALRHEMARTDSLTQPFGRAFVALVRHMPAPLNYINVQVIQSLPLLALVAGYSQSRLDRVALGGFLMAQVAHHYSALSTAITLTVMSMERPGSAEIQLDSVFRGWAHGRETPLLIGAPWPELLDLRVDQVREALGVTAFDSPFAAAMRKMSQEQART